MPNDSRRKCSIVVSVLNEGAVLPRFYEALCAEIAKLAALEWEIIFVDDGSTDGSYDILRGLHERDARVKVIRLSRNFGAHEGTAAGIRYASGDAAILMAADLQDPVDLIPAFVAKWKEGYQVVWGERRGRKDPLFKRMTASIFYWLVRRTASPAHPKRGSGSFCLIARQVIDIYNQMRERNRVTFELIAWMGFRQATIEYNRQERYAGASKFTLRRQIKTAVDGLFAMTQFPVRIISCLGFLAALISIGWGSLIIAQWFWYGTKVLGWASLMISVQFLGGVVLISIGALGEYVWRILDESRGRPYYIVMEKLGDLPERRGED